MTDTFVYTTYIKSTPEKVWQAITNPEFTRQYWGHNNVSEWKKGADWYHSTPDGKEIRVVGKVLESSPPSRLVLTWASPENKADESQVLFEIDAIEDLVRLNVTHSRLSAEMGGKVSQGWPRVLSSLKSLLETGKPLNTWAGKADCSSQMKKAAG